MHAYEVWATALRAEGRDFNYEEKRGLLRYFGVRVDVYRKNDKRLDGTHWELHTSLEDIDDFHKLGVEIVEHVAPPVRRTEHSANTRGCRRWRHDRVRRVSSKRIPAREIRASLVAGRRS
jgi:hypothetical protein